MPGPAPRCSDPAQLVKRIAWVVGLAALGTVATTLLFLDVSSSELSLSKEQFKGTFTSSLTAFSLFMVGQLRGACAMADALSVAPAFPNVANLTKVCVHVPARAHPRAGCLGVARLFGVGN